MVRYCKNCNKEFIAKRKNHIYCEFCGKKRKTEAVNKRRQKVSMHIKHYLGGKCIVCGYDRCDAALEAHHLDPSQKKFGLSTRGLTRSIEESLEEASKCVLLCANCHREFHAGLIDKAILSEALLLSQDDRRERAETIIGKPKHIENFCCDCGKEIYKLSTRCSKCNAAVRQKISWPDATELIKMVKETSYTSVARKLGVSDNAIRKRIKRH